MSADFFEIHGAAPPEPLPEEPLESTAEETQPEESVTVPVDDYPQNDWQKARSSWANLKTQHYEAASQILGMPMEDLGKLKPAEVAQQLQPKLEEFEGIRQAYEIAKPLVELLSKPVSQIDASELAQVLSAERPQVFNKLAEEIATTHGPLYAEQMVQNYHRYPDYARQAIDKAFEQHLIQQTQARFGVALTGDQIVEAVGPYVRALREGRQPSQGFGPQSFGPQYGQFGYQPQPLTEQDAQRIANQFGITDLNDPLIIQVHNREQLALYQQSQAFQKQFNATVGPLQQQLETLRSQTGQTQQQLQQRQQQETESQVSGQLDKVRDDLLGKLQFPKGYEDEATFIKGALKSRMDESASLTNLRDQIKGWYAEGKPGVAAGLIGRYTAAVGKMLSEIATPRLQRIAQLEKGKVSTVQTQATRRELPPGGQPASQSRQRPQYKDEDDMLNSVTARAMEALRQRKGA